MHGPTHNRGHTLDLLLSRGLNISSIVIKDVALSDHFCIFFDILISVTTELGVDRYVFFRADTDYYRSSRPITDILNRYTCLV